MSRSKLSLRKICNSTPAKAVGLLASLIAIVVAFQPLLHPKGSAKTTTAVIARGPSSTIVVGVTKTQPLPNPGITARVQDSSVTQTSFGPESPNVSGVKGNVEINFGSQPTSAASSERK